MFPVDKQGWANLNTFDWKNFAPGSRTFSDSWAAYLYLNELSYEQLLCVQQT